MTRRLLGFSAVLSSLSALIGLWFWYKEHTYASRYDSELAASLQWVGVGLFLLGVAGAVAFSTLGMLLDGVENREDLTGPRR